MASLVLSLGLSEQKSVQQHKESKREKKAERNIAKTNLFLFIYIFVGGKRNMPVFLVENLVLMSFIIKIQH